MPITKKEFEQGKVMSDIKKTVIAFLKKNHENAYTMTDIMDGINFQTKYSDLWHTIISGVALYGFQLILNELINEGEIRVNIINGIYYYMAN